ncbi:cell division protein FtsK [Bacillus mangrovi]|uniref:Cell division protein FtsK n=1 Tax=Metabacillus mangrovi TaxID=1491830 RepID=A0A7X2S8H3_9BACI|nr:DNA translocase FtsK [Metabacillus mangrovi]MTH55639.1 cell division protein FtsK [Metabacillus mangrovi]
MSWMSKFKQFMFGETEEIVEVVEYVRIDDEDEMPVEKKKQPANKLPNEGIKKSSHQLEAKIAYQYPEGKFRFPAIPDERQRALRPQRQRPAAPQQAESRKEERSSRKKPVAERKPGSQPKQAEAQKHVPKKPFQPTVIPSPIYGFRQRSEMESLPYKIREKTIAETRKHEEETLRKLSMHSSSFYKRRAADAAQKQAAAEKEEFFSKGTNPIPDYPPESQDDEEKPEVIVPELTAKDLPPLEPIMIADDPDETRVERSRLQLDMSGGHPSGEKFSLNGDHLSEEESSITGVHPSEEESSINRSPLSAVTVEEETMSAQARESVIEFHAIEAGGQVQDKERQETRSPQELYREEQEVSSYGELTGESLAEPVAEEKPVEISFYEAQETPAPQMEDQIAGTSPELPERIEPVQEESVPAQPVQRDRGERKNGAVPYNVLMLNRDRNRVKERVQEGAYHFPPLHLLSIPQKEVSDDREWLAHQRELLDSTLHNFNVRAKVVHVTQGPSVTRFEVQPEPGVKVNKITNLSDDIKLSLSAKDIRIEAPIPGKNAIGIEVPNLQSKTVSLREIIRTGEFKNTASPLTAALGLDISGQPIVTDLKKMPHGLIAGATGSGKSVCINSILISLLYKAAPHEVKMLLIDPKMVELAPYNRIPHLVSPVITDAKAATGALKWAVEEMERRYELFAHSGVRDISRYNELVKTHQSGEHMPYLVIVIDELADLMMVAPGEVEEAICRIAQKARACGIHLIVATQRPSVDVITGLIKANIPTRIAFSVSSQVDSRTILDTGGAEKLLGRGDMLFLENGTSKHLRVQGNFVSDEEIEQVVAHVKKQMDPVYLFNQEEFLQKSSLQTEEDDLFLEACEFVVSQSGASTSSLQRRFRIGYNRAARLIDMMEEQGIISEGKGSRPRDILISEEELMTMQES